MAFLPRRLPKLPTAPIRTSPRPVVSYKLPAQNVLLYADRGVVVINKSNGLTSQLWDPYHIHTEPNVDAELLMSLLEDIRETLKLREPLRTIHRLDKPTTGALALACSKESARNFSRQISSGECQKTYLALVCGDASAFKASKGIIGTPLVCENGRIRIPGVKDVYERDGQSMPIRGTRGENWTKDAITEYEVLAHSPKAPLSLLRLHLLTGIKHQLRVHLAQHLRTPILNDSLYLDPRSPVRRSIRDALSVPSGLFLHSSRIAMIRYCPSQFRLTISAPLPALFVELCQAARIPLTVDDESGGVWVNDTKMRGADIISPEDHRGGTVVEDAVQRLSGRWFGPSRPA